MKERMKTTKKTGTFSHNSTGQYYVTQDKQ